MLFTIQIQYFGKSAKNKLGLDARAKIKERRELMNDRKNNRRQIAELSKDILKSIRNYRNRFGYKK